MKFFFPFVATTTAKRQMRVTHCARGVIVINIHVSWHSCMLDARIWTKTKLSTLSVQIHSLFWHLQVLILFSLCVACFFLLWLVSFSNLLSHFCFIRWVRDRKKPAENVLKYWNLPPPDLVFVGEWLTFLRVWYAN